jgi:alpha-D-ribose 1-methylphosphonate 5-triphosphate diphosphatase
VTETIITNVRIVAPEEVVDGAAVGIEAGAIRCIDAAPGKTAPGAEVVDGRGWWLLPGLIDLHNDGIEMEIVPRPRTVFPFPVALESMENRLLSHGITTIYHSFSFLEGREGTLEPEKLEAAVRDLHRLRGRAAIRHFAHARYEVGEVEQYWRIHRLIEDGCLGLVSVMNHAPGQGQFRDLNNFISYYKRKHNIDSGDLQELVAERIRKSRSSMTAKTLGRLMADARAAGLPVASHDDDTPEKVAEMHGMGASIVEFPVELSAAAEAVARGMHVVVGAPNVLMGKSSSGNLKALEAIEAGAADVLCSDYYCPAVLNAVFGLYRAGTLELPEAVRMASLNPARAVGLAGRLGSIEPGKRADLVLVAEDGYAPRVVSVWVDGARVYEKPFPSAWPARKSRAEDAPGKNKEAAGVP